MLDYHDDEEKGNAVLDGLMGKLKDFVSSSEAAFERTSCGVISNLFTPDYDFDESFWDDFFDEEHSFFVTAIYTDLGGRYPMTWRIERGCIEFDESSSFVDAHGNRCDQDSTTVEVDGSQDGEDVFAAPVKKMIETSETGLAGRIYKHPLFAKDYYEESDLATDNLGEWLISPYDQFLLDKAGNRITAVSDFDHSEPDEEGYIYYPVPESDFEDGDGDEGRLTPEAVAKWKAKLGL
jgi:hypothetical protein